MTTPRSCTIAPYEQLSIVVLSIIMRRRIEARSASQRPSARRLLWMQRNGLEWLFRRCSEPRRLGRRYAYAVPGFLGEPPASCNRKQRREIAA